jgi:hypothetical protein
VAFPFFFHKNENEKMQAEEEKCFFLWDISDRVK